MKNILVLCTGNSCRSQMAEGYIRYFSAGRAGIYSAGIEAHGVNPLAVAVMKEDGLDISGHTSDTIAQYLHLPFDIVLTVCDNAQERCPVFPGTMNRVHYSFPDPARAVGAQEEVLQQFRVVRDMIKSYAREFVKQNLED
ncbi:MAG: arsenate reductase ArsC [Bacteroidetes bacterium]|nr:arsenate reductase ArsC [Bacteroidota bacterium]